MDSGIYLLGGDSGGILTERGKKEKRKLLAKGEKNGKGNRG